MEETWVKSNCTKYLEAIQEQFDTGSITNQYKLCASVIDALQGTNTQEQFSLDLLEAHEYATQNNIILDSMLSAYPKINPMFCTVGDVIVVHDEPYDDIAFCVGSHFMFVHDELQQIEVTQIQFSDIPENAIAYRLT